MSSQSPKIAYSFIRFSSKKQELSSSVRRQTQITEQYAKDNGLILDEKTRITALKVSGSTGKHIQKGSALDGFLQLAKAGKIPRGSALLVEKLDRLSRLEPSKAVRLFLDILSYGIEIHTVYERQVFTEQKVNEEISQLYISVGGLFAANRFSKDLGARLAWIWKEKKENAAAGEIATTKVPLWLRVVGRQNINGKMRGGHFEERDGRYAVLREIFNLKERGLGRKAIATHLNGGATRKKIRIAAELNSKQVPTWGKSKTWQDTYIQKILKNRAVLGEYQRYKKVNGKRVEDGPVIEHYYPAIIKPEQFLQCSVVQTKNTGAIGQGISNLFTHIAFDGYSGAKMKFVRSGNRTYLYSDAPRLQKNASVCGWSYSEFEDLFLEYITEADWETLTEMYEDKKSSASDTVKALEASLDSLRRIERNNARSFSAGVLNAELVRLDKENANAIAQKKKEIDRAKAQSATSFVAKKDFKKLVKGNDLETRASLRSEIAKIVERLDLFPNGTKKPVKSQKGFLVTFKNGERAFVDVNDENIKVLISPVAVGSHYTK